MAALDLLLLASFTIAAALLSLFAFHRLALVLRYRRARAQSDPASVGPPCWPFVTVQIPIYNEAAVARRIVGAASRLRYPGERLEIQILDDSTDETRPIVAQAVAEARARGVSIAHLTRPERTGYKAGALAHGLARARGEVIAVFDADFVPPRDFLLRTAPCFANPEVGMVQARWDHLNRDHSIVTRLQALLLDAHFEIEHRARNASGHFFNFNGTAGVWRRACIEDAGGWEHDTLTEDLDLSYRAQLRGWKFVYLDGLRVPAELPLNIDALKTQQHRWTKGAVQTCRKLLGSVWRSRARLAVKLEASFHLLDHFACLVVFGLTVIIFPLLMLRAPQFPPGIRPWIGAWPLVLGLLALGVFYGTAARRCTGADGKRILLWVPLMMALFAGLGVTLVRAVVEGLFGRDVTFLRTPKYNSVGRRVLSRHRYAAPFHPSVMFELLLAFHHGVMLVASARAGWPLLALVYALFAAGLLWVATASLHERRELTVATAS